METKPPVLSDLLLAEVLPAWSRQTITLASAASAAVPVGSVLTAAGVAPAANATATSAAVLIEPLKVGDTQALVVARGAVVDPARLVWAASASDAQIATGLAALAALGIVPKTVI
ncbi:MAG: head decoration protein [Azoarcus sp.]|jgi:hypothetical protein|nr:head decoration protein [Azoarcus sp.]